MKQSTDLYAFDGTGYIEGVRVTMTVSEGMEEVVMETAWVRTADRTPEPETDVLCFYDDMPEAHVLSIGADGEWYRQCDGGSSWAPPSHWMPLPEPPSREADLDAYAAELPKG